MAEDLSAERIAELVRSFLQEARKLTDERAKEFDHASWDELTRRIHALEDAADALSRLMDDDVSRGLARLRKRQRELLRNVPDDRYRSAIDELNIAKAPTDAADRRDVERRLRIFAEQELPELQAYLTEQGEIRLRNQIAEIFDDRTSRTEETLKAKVTSRTPKIGIPETPPVNRFVQLLTLADDLAGDYRDPRDTRKAKS